VLICLTTSGKSGNVERALEEAKAHELKTIAFLGRDGGSTIGMADVGLWFAAIPLPKRRAVTRVASTGVNNSTEFLGAARLFPT